MPTAHSVRLTLARRLLALAIGSTLSMAGACPEDSPTAPMEGAGTYSLVSVAGQALPFIQSFDSSGVTVTETIKSGTVSLAANGTWTYTMSVHVKRTVGTNTLSDADQTWSGSGTFTRNGDEFTFKESGQADLTATLTGTTFSWVDPNGITWVYGKT